MNEPTVQLFEGGIKHKVTDLPGWHEHPECDGLRHLHGMSEQAPHTHLPVKSWGKAVPLACDPSQTSTGVDALPDASLSLPTAQAGES